MSFIDEYRKRYETPADILYCPCCAASSENWEVVFYSKKFQNIVGCDACVREDEDFTGDCPICGAKGKDVYITKVGHEVVGCDGCISLEDYDTCVQYHKEEML